MGGVYTWAAVPAMLGCAALGITRRPRIAASPETRLLDGALLACLAGVALQLLPLPMRLLSGLSPASVSVRSALALEDRSAIAWQELSIDPGATLYGLCLAAATFVLFWVGRDMFHDGGIRRVVRMIAWLGACPRNGGNEPHVSRSAPRIGYGPLEHHELHRGGRCARCSDGGHGHPAFPFTCNRPDTSSARCASYRPAPIRRAPCPRRGAGIDGTPAPV